MKISSENYNEESDERHLLEIDVQYIETLHEIHNHLHFYLKEWKLKKSKSL